MFKVYSNHDPAVVAMFGDQLSKEEYFYIADGPEEGDLIGAFQVVLGLREVHYLWKNGSIHSRIEGADNGACEESPGYWGCEEEAKAFLQTWLTQNPEHNDPSSVPSVN